MVPPVLRIDSEIIRFGRAAHQLDSARARGDAAAYAKLRDRYRDMARMLGSEGHIAWAEAMP